MVGMPVMAGMPGMPGMPVALNVVGELSMVGVLVIVAEMRGMQMTVVQIVDVVVMGDRLMATVRSVLVPVAFSLTVAPTPTASPYGRTNRGDQIPPDRDEHDGAA